MDKDDILQLKENSICIHIEKNLKWFYSRNLVDFVRQPIFKND